MIHVTIVKKKDQILSFELSGHAESGPYGYDLVCAGVSAVTFGMVNAVLELCNVDLNISQGDKGGYLKVTLPDKEEIPQSTYDKIQTLIQGMIISLQTIERGYGEHIQIKEKQEV